ncbi:hypothetical protein JW859_05910 [bacterium]|nr:hypothetical protein [bacterium]
MREQLRINGEVLLVSANVGADATAVVRLGDDEYKVVNVSREDGALSFDYDGARYRFHLRSTGDLVEVTDGAAYHRFQRIEEGAAEEDEGGGELTSQMPGTVLKHLVSAGAEVKKGTPLLILEAMKMEHEVAAPADGVVTGFPFREGARVMPGDLLVEFEATEPGEA